MWDRRALERRRRRVRGWISTVLAVAVVAGVAVGWFWWTNSSPWSQRAEVVTQGFVATYVSDGDTLVVTDATGNEHSVRLIGVNAPEITHGALAGECFGNESRDLARTLLPRGAPVTLVSDPGLPSTDQYGRQLAYVESNGIDVGQLLLERGAVVVYELRSQKIPARSQQYRAAERQASGSRTGLWGACPSPPTRHR